MQTSKLFGKTVKDVSQDMPLASHRLLYQAGFIRESVAGRYFFLPLGMRVQDKIVAIIEEEMSRAGAQKMITPVLHPLELWQETNRTNSVGFELMTIKDRRGTAFALGGTAEEMMVDVVRKFNVSYKDLPFNIYQFSQKFRDEMRARGGLLRVREFLMKDAYSFHVDETDFQKEYRSMWETYLRIFKRVGLDVIPIEADNGYIGGDYCHEFVVVSPVGESRFLMTEDRAYAAHEEVASFGREPMNPDEKELPLKVVDAPRGPSIEAGVQLYKQPAWRQIKTLVFIVVGASVAPSIRQSRMEPPPLARDARYCVDKGEAVLVSIRGDLDVSETKLKKALNAYDLRPARPEEIRELGSVVGFVSPLKLKRRKIGDLSLATVKNFYTGADEDQKDTLNVNYGRDFTVDLLVDVAVPPVDCRTPDGKMLQEARGIEVGNIFQLGTHYSLKMSRAVFTDKDGKSKPYYMGCYGIGVGRTLATVVEVHHDDKGIVWPKAIAPYQVHLIHLGKEPTLYKAAEKLYKKLESKGFDVLWDDRDTGTGEKLTDADLIGIPVRLVLSQRSLEKGGLEWKERSSPETRIVSEKDLLSQLASTYEL